MLVGLSGWLAGYNGSFAFESGHQYPEDVNYTAMRVFNALWGSLLVPLAYLTARQFKMSQRASILAATMVLLGKLRKGEEGWQFGFHVYIHTLTYIYI